MRVEQYAFLPDTEGPGKYRGALGIVRDYRILSSEAMVQVRQDRFLHAPWGIFGGEEGACASACLIQAPTKPKFCHRSSFASCGEAT